jgi:hypothetical protein
MSEILTYPRLIDRFVGEMGREQIVRRLHSKPQLQPGSRNRNERSVDDPTEAEDPNRELLDFTHLRATRKVN